MFDIVIRGAAGVAGDIGIEGERIAAVGLDLPGGSEEIDAFGLTVFPGLIDVHVHFNDPGRSDWEGAETGSRAFTAGGGTLFVDMPLNSSPCTLDAGNFDLKLAALEASSITDFALWGGIVPGNRGSLAELAERGVVGFKAFLCNSGLPEFPRADDRTLYDGMREAARLGLPVAVHAENEELTRAATGADIAAFLESRPVVAEVEAITRAALLAREAGCRLHIVHISSGRGVAAALEARALGTDISIETCPHYLFFTDADLYRLGPVAKCAPPLRTAAERGSLWSAVLRGEVDIIGSDHSPCPPEMKARGNFLDIWGGIAGIQTTLPVLIECELSHDRIVATTAANGARRFGFATKGRIETGLDADMVLVDTNAAFDVTEHMLLQRHRVSPYIGSRLRGVVRRTIRRGETIYMDGAITAKSTGRLVRPERNSDA